MLLKIILIFAGGLFAVPVLAQQSAESPSPQPQVKVNVLNVCTPSAEEQKEISAALARIPKQPSFGPDFEVSHGVSTLTEADGPSCGAPTTGVTARKRRTAFHAASM